MKPILYPPEEREFNSNGLGVLSDAISCTVTWEGNGIFDLTMEYPMDGIHFGKITDRCIIMAIPTPYRDPQPFRISRITKNMDGTAEVYAQHVAYDLAGVPVRPFSATGASATLAGLNSNSVTDSGFTFWTDISSSAKFSMEKPASVWDLLGGSEGSILDVFGGQYEFDRWAVKLHGQLGQDNDVTIRYGKNLTDLEQERNLSYMYTGVYSFWADSDGNYVQCDPAVVPVNGSESYNNVLVLDLSSEFQDKPTPAQLTNRTKRYITDNDLGKPRVSITLTHEMLEQTDEYAGLSLLERCSVFDTVHVQFEKLGVNATAKIASAETDVLRERYNSLKVGSVEANIADTIAGQQTAIQKRPTITSVQQIATALAAVVTGANGGAVRMLDKNGDGMPDEFYIANDPDPAKATKVWRFNYEGFLASKNGYNGPYNMIGTFDGFYADAIVAGTLTAVRIQSADGRSSWDLAGGAAIFNADSIQINSTNFKLDAQGNVTATGTFSTNNGVTGAGRNVATLSSGQLILTRTTSDGQARQAAELNGIGNNASFGNLVLYGTLADGIQGQLAYITGEYDGSHMALKDGFGSGKVTFNGSSGGATFAGDVNVQGPVGLGVDRTVSCQGLNCWDSGQKKGIVKTSFGNVSMVAFETPEPCFADSGSATLDENGLCLLTLHPVYAETIDKDKSLRWLITPTKNGTAWVEKRGACAMVHGTPGLTFDWMCIGAQRGYAAVYAERCYDARPVSTVEAESALDWLEQTDSNNQRESDALLDEYDWDAFTNSLFETEG